MVSTLPTTKSGLSADPREDWLAQYTEEVIDPARPIVDPHHHLWDRGGLRYMIEEMTDDIVDDHRCVTVRSRTARTLGRPNLKAVERLCVSGRQASGSRVPEPMVIGTHQHDGDERIVEDPLHHPADTVKNRF